MLRCRISQKPQHRLHAAGHILVSSHFQLFVTDVICQILFRAISDSLWRKATKFGVPRPSAGDISPLAQQKSRKRFLPVFVDDVPALGLSP